MDRLSEQLGLLHGARLLLAAIGARPTSIRALRSPPAAKFRGRLYHPLRTLVRMVTAAGSGITELVAELSAIDVSASDREALAGATAGLRRVRAWVDALELHVARRMVEVSSYPEKALADAGGVSVRAGERVLRRAEVVELAPAFGAALRSGALTAGHVDAFGRTLRQLEPDQRSALIERADRFAAVAGASTVEDFARGLRRETNRLAADEGMARAERQRRATRLRTWVDVSDGMWCLSGRFAPELGLCLHGRLEAAISALFTDQSPEYPSDPGEQQDHRRALALVALAEGRGGRGARPEIVVVVDTTQLDDGGQPTIDWGLPVEIPVRVLHTLAGTADVCALVIRNGVVLHAPGILNLGRSTRLGNRAQRRALRAMYATCAIPGCAVLFDHTKAHHVDWWEHGGSTDLDNLVPLCERHHHAVHERGWILQLGPRRELTVRTPDGEVMTTGPPSRRSACNVTSGVATVRRGSFPVVPRE